LEPDEEGKATTAWTLANPMGDEPNDAEVALAALLAPVKPRRSVASLVSAIEDAAAEAEMDAVIVINQGTETVRVSTGADLSAFTVAGTVPLATVTQTEPEADPAAVRYFLE
jgi:flagellar basal body P-ring protein FlgI